MKRTKFAAALAVLTLLTTLTGCGQAKEADGALEPVTLNEVAHSIFYAPQYACLLYTSFRDSTDLTENTRIRRNYMNKSLRFHLKMCIRDRDCIAQSALAEPEHPPISILSTTFTLSLIHI